MNQQLLQCIISLRMCPSSLFLGMVMKWYEIVHKILQKSRPEDHGVSLIFCQHRIPFIYTSKAFYDFLVTSFVCIYQRVRDKAKIHSKCIQPTRPRCITNKHCLVV